MAKAQRNNSKKPPVADNSGKFPSDAPKDQSFPFQEKSGPMGQSGNEQLPFQEMQPSLPTQQISPAMTASLSSVLTRRYKNVSAMGDRTALMLNMNQPIFSRIWIKTMRRDPSLWYGIQMLRGPIISKAKYTVESDHPEVVKFVQRQLNRFVIFGLPQMLDSLEWGYCGCEVLYRFSESRGLMEFNNIKYIQPEHARPVLNPDGSLIGMYVKEVGQSEYNGIADYNNKDEQGNVFVPLRKMLWTVHDRKSNRWYGRSRYEGAFIPWFETWQPKGFRNIRHLWLYKNAFDSGVIRYPEGYTPDPVTGTPIPNVVIAQQLADQRESGASIIMPSATSPDGLGDWDYEQPRGMTVPEGLFMYGDSLRDEKWEGLGVPPEVAKNEGTGSFAGRRVPQQAFYSFLQEIANEQIYDFDEQVVRFLVFLNFGPNVEYEIVPIPILVTLQQEEMGTVTGDIPDDSGTQNIDPGGQSVENGLEEEEDPDNPFPDEGPPEETLSNGRIEDRGSNAFNIAEKAAAVAARKKAKKQKG